MRIWISCFNALMIEIAFALLLYSAVLNWDRLWSFLTEYHWTFIRFMTALGG